MKATNESEEILRAWNEAEFWNIERASARGEVIRAFLKFEGSYPFKKARAKFSLSYNNRKLPFESNIYKEVRRVSPGWIKKYAKLYRKFGDAGLLSRHGTRKGKFCLSPEHLKKLDGISYKNPRARAARIVDYFIAEVGPIASRRTLERRIKEWRKRNKQIQTLRKDPIAWRNRYQISQGRADEDAKFINDLWEIDSSPADIVCKDGLRYICVAAVDVYSRKALVLLSRVSKASAIMALIRMAIDKWGRPRRIKTDQGKDYISRDLQTACKSLEIDLIPVLPGRPDLKPHIEAFFRTLAYTLFEELPGYIGHSTGEAKILRETRRFSKAFIKHGNKSEIELSREELQTVINKWLLKYEQRKHRSLNASPAEQAARSPEKPKRLNDIRLLDILLVSTGWRVVHKGGISYKGGLYLSADLYPHINERVEIREDCSNAGIIYVFNRERKFLFIATDERLAGMTTEDHQQNRKAQNQWLKKDAQGLEEKAKGVPDFPMLAWIEKPAAGGQIIQGPWSENIKIPNEAELLKAADARDRIISGKESVTEIPEEDGNYYGSDFYTRTYKDILGKIRRGEDLTPREMEIKREYEESWEGRAMRDGTDDHI